MTTTSVVGGIVRRAEDPALIRGEGLFVDDVSLTGMFHAAFDYPLPTAGDLPSFELARITTPTDVNQMGVKGIGGAGTIGAAQTIVNAVVDVLAPPGVKHIEMPLRPRRVWQAIQDAEGVTRCTRDGSTT